jgi:DNA-binding transcriptional ArsR family regulator
MKRSERILSRPGQLGALASPVRQEIVDTLEALGGEAPVAALAAQLGRPSDGLYYHLRLLVRAGVLEELADVGDGRRYRTAGRRAGRLRLRYLPGSTANARAVERVAGGMLRIARRDFGAAIRTVGTVVAGPGRTLWACRTKAWVGKAELEAINRMLERVIVLLQGGPSPTRRQLVSVTWVVAPVEARPPRRGPAT